MPRMENNREQCGLGRRRAENIRWGWEWMTEVWQSIDKALALTPSEMGPQ